MSPDALCGGRNMSAGFKANCDAVGGHVKSACKLNTGLNTVKDATMSSICIVRAYKIFFKKGQKCCRKMDYISKDKGIKKKRG